jgi:hypothetical protein
MENTSFASPSDLASTSQLASQNNHSKPLAAHALHQAPQHEDDSQNSQFERALDYPIYTPNSRGNGSVIRFGFNRSKAAIFVEATVQSGEKQFDWERKIIMKWSLSDIGSALAVLQGRVGQTKLFHQSEKANSTFEITFREDPERAPYLMSISRQSTHDKTVQRVVIPVSHAEAAILETTFRKAITRILNW